MNNKLSKMIRFLIIAMLLLGGGPAWGATTQVIISGSSDTPNTTNTEYLSITGAGNGSNAAQWTSTQSKTYMVVPTSGTFSNLKVQVVTAPGAGNTRTLTIMKGTDSTSLSCTLSDTDTSCSSSATASFSAGELVSISNSVTSAPIVSSVAKWSLTWTPSVDDETIIMGNTYGVNIGSGTNYLTLPGSRDGTTTTLHDASVVFPTAGSLKKLFVEISATPGVGNTRTFTIGGLSCTINNPDTSCSDTSNTETITAGDKRSITHTETGTPSAATARWGVVFSPTTTGQFIIPMCTNNITGTTTEYISPVGGIAIFTTTEESTKYLAQSMTIKAVYVSLPGTPGAGKSIGLGLRVNLGASSPALSCTVSDTNTTCNASADVSIANNDYIDTEEVPTNSPTNRAVIVSYLGYVAPTSSTSTRRIIITDD